MQYKMGMPVLLAGYPNSQAYHKFAYDSLPELPTNRYRVQFMRSYLTNMWYEKPKHMEAVRENLPKEFHKLLDDYDQDHAIVLGEGTKAGIF